MNESGQMQHEHLFSLLEQLNKQIRELQRWLRQKAVSDNQVQLLLTQRGVGYLTALATVHTLGDVSLFQKVSKLSDRLCRFGFVGEIQCGQDFSFDYH